MEEVLFLYKRLARNNIKINHAAMNIGMYLSNNFNHTNKIDENLRNINMYVFTRYFILLFI